MNTNEKNIENCIQLDSFSSTIKEVSISILKAKINSEFPFWGSTINEFLFDLPDRIKQDRVNRLVNILETKVKQVESSSIKLEFLKSEEFFDLMQKVLESSLKANVEFKRNFLANVFIDSIKTSSIDNDLTLIFCDFISSMSVNHINILHFINKNESDLVEIGSYPNYYEKFCQFSPNLILDKYEFKYYTTDLEAKGLISTGGGLENFDDKSSIQVYMNHRDASIFLTSLGKKFINFLTEN